MNLINLNTVKYPGTSIFSHNHENQFTNVTKCSSTSCFNLSLTYSDPIETIKKVVKESDHCFQTLWFGCQSSKITQFASWTDFNGNHHEYFSSNQNNICECAKNGSCSVIGQSKTECNCDHASPIERQDEIQIHDKVKMT